MLSDRQLEERKLRQERILSSALEVFKANGEQPKYPHVDYEEMRKIVQDNFGYLGVKVREWKKKNT